MRNHLYSSALVLLTVNMCNCVFVFMRVYAKKKDVWTFVVLFICHIVWLLIDRVVCTLWFSKCVHFYCKPPLTHELVCVCVCLCLPGVQLWRDCSSAVSVGGRVCVSAMPRWPGAFQGETIKLNKMINNNLTGSEGQFIFSSHIECNSSLTL